MDDGYSEITMLIGADYYWSIVQDNVIRGDGPTAVQSKLGYLLSGPVAGYNQKSHTPLMMNILASHTQEEVDLEKFWKVESLAIERTESDRNSDIYLADYQFFNYLPRWELLCKTTLQRQSHRPPNKWGNSKTENSTGHFPIEKGSDFVTSLQ